MLVRMAAPFRDGELTLFQWKAPLCEGIIQNQQQDSSRAAFSMIIYLEGLTTRTPFLDGFRTAASSGAVGGVGLRLPCCVTIGPPCILANGGSEHGNSDSRLALRPAHVA